MRALRYLVPAGIFVLGLGLLLAFGASEVSTANRRAEDSLRKHVSATGTIVASAVEIAARRDGIEEAPVSFGQTKGDRRLIEALIVDHTDRALYASTLTLRGRQLDDSGLRAARPLLQAARTTLTAQTRIEADGQSILSVFPIRLSPAPDEFVTQRIGALLMRHSLAGEKAQALSGAIQRVTVLGLVLAALCAATWLFFERVLVLPVRALVHAADRLAADEAVSSAAAPGAAAEIARLSDAFDHMSSALQQRTRALQESQLHLEERVEARTEQLRQAQAELVRTERLAALGQLTATVAHELRNPLGTLRNTLKLITDSSRTNRPLDPRWIELTARNIARCDRIVSELLDYTREVKPQRVSVELDAWLRDALLDYARSQDVRAPAPREAPVYVSIDGELMLRVLYNLLDNAIDATEALAATSTTALTPIELRIDTQTDTARLSVIDHGTGISAKHLEHLFDPLFSTKSFGVGLGLNVVRNIVEGHGGQVEAHSDGHAGSTFTVVLPLAGAPAAQPTRPRAGGEVASSATGETSPPTGANA